MRISHTISSTIVTAAINAVVRDSDIRRVITSDLIGAHTDKTKLGRMQAEARCIRIQQELGRVTGDAVEAFLADFKTFLTTYHGAE